MTDKELSKLGRNELLEMLLEQISENERLTKELQAAQEQLQKKEIAVTQSGTLAEAALRVSGIFEAADTAVKLYTDNIIRFTEGKKEDYDRVIAEAEEKAKDTIRQAEEKAEKILRDADEESKSRIAMADAYCGQMSEKIEAIYQSQAELGESLRSQLAKKKRRGK